MAKHAPLTEEQKTFLKNYLSGKNSVQKKILTDEYKDYVGRRAKAQAQIDVLPADKPERKQLEARMAAADQKAEAGKFKGAYQDLKSVKVDARKAANGFKSSLTTGNLRDEIDRLDDWITSTLQERELLLGGFTDLAPTARFDRILQVLRDTPPVSDKPNKEEAFAHLKDVSTAISSARVALGSEKGELDLSAKEFEERVDAGNFAQRKADLEFKIAQFDKLQNGAGAPLTNLLQAVADRFKQVGLDKSESSFKKLYQTAYEAADKNLNSLAKQLTDLNKFRNPESVFTDAQGMALSPDATKQLQAKLAQTFQAAEKRDQARVEDAYNRMEADLENDRIAFSVDAPQGPLARLERFDSFDMFESMPGLPAKADEWVVVRAVKSATDAIKLELEKLLALGPNNDVLFDVATKSLGDWTKEIEEGMGLDLSDAATDPSIVKLVESMAQAIMAEVGKAYPNKAAPDMSTFELNGVTYGNRRKLGSGGGGDVYTYETLTEPIQKIVLKEPKGFKPGSGPSSEAFEDFATEARNHREVTGGEKGKAPKNILAMNGLVLAPNGQPLLAMELAGAGDAQTFSTAINAAKETGLISPEAQNAMVQDAVKQMALGIKQMQDAGMSHHDLKEANVFVMADGTFKIADFGLANILDDHDDRVAMDEFTPGYEPAELVEKGKLGQKSDNFTLGAILDLMTDPSRRSGELGRQFGGDKVVSQQTRAPVKGRPGETAVVKATALDRLRNALLDVDEDARPNMTQVLLSTYLNEAETTHKPADLDELRLACTQYSQSVGRKTGKIEEQIQTLEGEIGNLELDRHDDLGRKQLQHLEDVMDSNRRQKPRWESELDTLEKQLAPLRLEMADLPPKPTRDQLKAAKDDPEASELRKLNQKHVAFKKLNDRKTLVQKKLTSLDAKLQTLQKKHQETQAAKGQPRGDSVLRELDAKIDERRKQIIALRKEIEAIHQSPEHKSVVERLKKANEAFR